MNYHYLDAAITLVPLKSGGGTRLKVLEAIPASVPVVSTSLSCEGLNVRDCVDLQIADTPTRFVDCICKLKNDEHFRDGVIQRARETVEEEYDWKLIAQQHDQLYCSLVDAAHA